MSPTDPHRRTVLRTLLSLGAVLAVPSAIVRGEDAPDSEPSPDDPETFVASVDRIVDGRFVVLLLEDEGRVVDQLVVPREELPTVEEGDVLLVTLVDGELDDFQLLEEETERRRERAEERLSELLDQ